MLKSECTICGARRKFKNLVYDQSLNAYCQSAMGCSNAHPNSPQNYRQRGTYIELLPYEEALLIQRQRTEYAYEETANQFGKRIRKVNMHKLITGSISFRVQSEAQADYISYMMAKTGTNKITDAVHYILNQAIEKDAGFIASYTQRRGAYVATPHPEIEVEFEADEPAPTPKILPTRKLENDEGVFTL
jgi:hypothetical protein